jgi:hypothetical protein
MTSELNAFLHSGLALQATLRQIVLNIFVDVFSIAKFEILKRTPVFIRWKNCNAVPTMALHTNEQLSRFSTGKAIANDDDFSSFISRVMDRDERLYVRGLAVAAMGVSMNDMSEFMVRFSIQKSCFFSRKLCIHSYSFSPLLSPFKQ